MQTRRISDHFFLGALGLLTSDADVDLKRHEGVRWQLGQLLTWYLLKGGHFGALIRFGCHIRRSEPVDDALRFVTRRLTQGISSRQQAWSEQPYVIAGPTA
jgi:hypothetical protein